MKRGCTVFPVHFHAFPLQDRTTIDKVTELARILTGVGVNVQPDPPKPPVPPGYIRAGLFEFNPNRHDYSVKHFLGHTIEGSGFPEVQRALDILAHERRTGALDGDLLSLFIAVRPWERADSA